MQNKVSDEILDRFRKVTSATVYSAVWGLSAPSGQEWFASANYQLSLYARNKSFYTW
ncbi:MAG: hypothetical protein Ct9H90mP2_14400 [Dehalococcoidia bacterium]|nr:MAG: hypothetical protein Ct9H90mP2_14400 [Dehalococcoidia bacterium]